jgi:hypothetical protein
MLRRKKMMHEHFGRAGILGLWLVAVGCGPQGQDDTVVSVGDGSESSEPALTLENSGGDIQSCWGYYAIKSLANGRYVTTEVGTGDHGSRLQARAERIGPWEKFFICDHPLGGKSIKSALNQGYVSAEIFYPEPFAGMLRARANFPGEWEQFSFVIGPNTAIYSVINGAFVTAEIFYGEPYAGLLRARAASARQWEQFAIVAAPAP